MAYSDVTFYRVSGTDLVEVEARGGTRRQRAAGIAAELRRQGMRGRRVRVSYSETYGFQTLTSATYQVTESIIGLASGRTETATR